MNEIKFILTWTAESLGCRVKQLILFTPASLTVAASTNNYPPSTIHRLPFSSEERALRIQIAFRVRRASHTLYPRPSARPQSAVDGPLNLFPCHSAEAHALVAFTGPPIHRVSTSSCVTCCAPQNGWLHSVSRHPANAQRCLFSLHLSPLFNYFIWTRLVLVHYYH